MQGVVFDFDGTIAMSEPLHAAAWVELAGLLGWPLPHGFVEKGVGLTDEELAVELAGYWGRRLDDDDILQRKRRIFQARAPEASTLVPGITDVLAELEGQLPMAIATSACRADVMPILERNRLVSYFSVIVTVEDVRQPKPHPEIYLKAAAAIGVDPGVCMAFEDSPTGIRAATAAGMQVVGLTTSFQRHDLPPVREAIADYTDLAMIMRLLNRP